jgi:hypothetical protein
LNRTPTSTNRSYRFSTNCQRWTLGAVAEIRVRLDMTEPSIKKMRIELREAGWSERNLTTYIDPNGTWYRGPYGAWKEMKRRQSILKEKQ